MLVGRVAEVVHANTELTPLQVLLPPFPPSHTHNAAPQNLKEDFPLLASISLF